LEKNGCIVFQTSIKTKILIQSETGTLFARVKGFNRASVAFFDILTAELEKHNYNPRRIFNVDETG
jgi:hypothetical protein